MVGHQAVIRAILAYFLDRPHHELPYLQVPLHTVVRLTPRAYGCQATCFSLDIDAVDTYRPNPLLQRRNASSLDSSQSLPFSFLPGEIVKVSASDLLSIKNGEC